MRQLKEGPPVHVPSAPFGDLVVSEGETISEAAYERLAADDRPRFKKVRTAVQDDSPPSADAPEADAQTPE